MSEAAAALLGGEGGGAPPADGGGGAPVAVPDWAKEFEPDLAEWVGKKALPDVKALAKSYRELEGFRGRSVVLPEAGADAKEWDTVYKRLGRPDEPKGYGFTATDQADTKIADGMMAAFWRAGLNQGQAESLWGAISELASTDGDDAARTAKNQSDHADLRREWGPSYDQKVTLGARAARAMGIGKDELNAIENALGTRFVLEKMANLGESLREDAGVGVTAGAPAAAATPEAAKARIETLKSDKEFQAKLHAGDKASQAQWDSLFRTAYPS